MVGVTFTGLAEMRAKLARLPKKVQTASEEYIYRNEVSPTAELMRMRAHSLRGPAKLAAATLRVERVKGGGGIRAGGGSGKGSLTMKGSEFGGRKRPRKPYAKRSRKGTPYIVRRRTTMQFAEYLGNRGYWFFPAMRTQLKGVIRRIEKVVGEVIDHG